MAVKPVQTILEKEMTRKEFLATMALGVASASGIMSSLNAILPKKTNGRSISSTSKGYGSGYYG